MAQMIHVADPAVYFKAFSGSPHIFLSPTEWQRKFFPLNTARSRNLRAKSHPRILQAVPPFGHFEWIVALHVSIMKSISWDVEVATQLCRNEPALDPAQLIWQPCESDLAPLSTAGGGEINCIFVSELQRSSVFL